MSIRKQLASASLGGLGLSLALIAAASMGSADSFGQVEVSAKAHAQVLDLSAPLENDDTSTIAQYLGISPEQVREQRGWQDQLRSIDLAALDPGYAGVSTTLGPRFDITYYSASPKTGQVADQLRQLGLLRYTSFQTVPYPLEVLRGAQEAIHDTASDIPGETTLDFVTGEVVVRVEDLPDSGVVDRLRSKSRVPVRWEVVPSLMEPALGGGNAMSTCTAGFVVIKTDTGNRGISTAGHCPDDQNYQGVDLNFKAASTQNHADVQWHDKANTTWLNTVNDGDGGPRSITTKQSYSGMLHGDSVCKTGKITGYDCGIVTDLTVCPTYIQSCNATFVEVSPYSGHDLANPGDSGGPVFYENQAWGLISGESGVYMLFMPQEYMSVLGIKVALS
jgi:hypothetical protein